MVIKTVLAMDDDTDQTLPGSLRFLKILVTVLTATMILGVLAIIALLVIRLQTPARPVLPETLVLPDGAEAAAVTFGQGWTAVVTTDDRILIFAPDGTLKQTVVIAR